MPTDETMETQRALVEQIASFIEVGYGHWELAKKIREEFTDKEPVVQELDAARMIKGWFEKAVPDPLPKNLTTQLGCHFEEIAEMMTELDGDTLASSIALNEAYDTIHKLAEDLKAGKIILYVSEENRADYLDALCDQVVTAIGVGHMEKMDIVGGLIETALSNNSKFDQDGNPIFNADRKIMKGPQFFKADYKPFV